MVLRPNYVHHDIKTLQYLETGEVVSIEYNTGQKVTFMREIPKVAILSVSDLDSLIIAYSGDAIRCIMATEVKVLMTRSGECTSSSDCPDPPKGFHYECIGGTCTLVWGPPD